MEELANDPRGQARLRAAEERINRALSERLEAHDKKAQASNNQGGASSGSGSGPSMQIPMPLPDLPANDGAEGGHSQGMIPIDPLDRSGLERSAPSLTPIGRSALEQSAPSMTWTRTGSNNDQGTPSDDAMDQGPPAGDTAMDTDFIEGDDVATLLVMQLGGGRPYARERRAAYKRVVSEIFSPPMLKGHLFRFRNRYLAPGVALDLSTIDPTDGRQKVEEPYPKLVVIPVESRYPSKEPFVQLCLLFVLFIPERSPRFHTRRV